MSVGAACWSGWRQHQFAFQGGAQDDAGVAGEAHLNQFAQHGFQRGHVGYGDFQDATVVPGDAVAFQHAVVAGGPLDQGGVVASAVLHADEGGDGASEGFASHAHAVSQDDLGVFEAADAFGDGGGAEAHAAAQFAHAEARVGLEFLQDAVIEWVEGAAKLPHGQQLSI